MRLAWVVLALGVIVLGATVLRDRRSDIPPEVTLSEWTEYPEEARRETAWTWYQEIMEELGGDVAAAGQDPEASEAPATLDGWITGALWARPRSRSGARAKASQALGL